MWRKKYLSLTKEQKERGVVFSSTLRRTNVAGDKPEVHEVFKDDPEMNYHIYLLKDVTFFKNMARDFGWNVVEEIRQ